MKREGVKAHGGGALPVFPPKTYWFAVFLAKRRIKGIIPPAGRAKHKKTAAGRKRQRMKGDRGNGKDEGVI